MNLYMCSENNKLFLVNRIFLMIRNIRRYDIYKVIKYQPMHVRVDLFHHYESGTY